MGGHLDSGSRSRRPRRGVPPAGWAAVLLLLSVAILGATACRRAKSAPTTTQSALSEIPDRLRGGNPFRAGPAVQIAAAGDTRAKTAEDDDGKESSSTAKPSKPESNADKEEAADEHPFLRRLRVPELKGGVAWINTSGPLELKDLRGKFVLLDFWTYCCINCMHILPELKKLEAAYPKQLVVIGVHSAKFDTEADSKNITEAVLRYEIEHPVVNDSNHAIWDSYGVRSWPTAILIDPEGYAVWGRSGEFKFEDVDAILKHGLPYYRKKGVLDESPLRFDLAAERADETPLRFPGKVLADEEGNRLFIADSNHNRIVIARLDGTLLDTIGTGALGADDGDYATATFNHPQGMALKGSTLYVADTENHLLRKIDLDGKQVETIAGLGRQARGPWPGIDLEKAATREEAKLPDRFVGKPRDTELNSPWDVAVHGDNLFIAMAGPHQIWKMPLKETEIGPYAGNGREDIVDGPLLPKEPYEEGYASFAQPSGLAANGKWLYVADSEGSSIRAVPFGAAGEVHTVVGTAFLPVARLFTFGDRDGQGEVVRLQHPLGVAWHNGKVYVADTYNNKIKVVDPVKLTCQTIAGTGKAGHDNAAPTFDEPEGLSGAGAKLYVADTNNHLIRVVDLGKGHRVSTLEIKGLSPPKLPDRAESTEPSGGKKIEVAPVTLKPTDGLAWLAVKLELPEGWKINVQAPMRYKVKLADETGPIDRDQLEQSAKVDPPMKEFQVELPVKGAAGKETVDVSLAYYYCQEGPSGVCKAGSVTWTVPLTIDRAAEKSTAPLTLKVE